MKNLFYLIIFFVIIGCSTNKVVYWCGDHPCINKKEKEAYFKKTMVVEMKELKKTNINNNSEIEKIIQQAKLDQKQGIKQEKDLIKQAKLDEKRRIKEEKNLAKQIQKDEKQRIEQEKDLIKQAKLDEKRRIKEEKNLAKQIQKDEKKIIKKGRETSKQKVLIDTGFANIEIEATKFKELVEKITKKNLFRPYPDINDIPN